MIFDFHTENIHLGLYNILVKSSDLQQIIHDILDMNLEDEELFDEL